MSIEPVNPTMTRDELVAAAESIGMRFPAPVAQDAPLGAILNGRAHMDRLEGYPFECEAGPLTLCTDWVELRRCFEHLADWVQAMPAAPAPVLTPATSEQVNINAARCCTHKVDHPSTFILGWRAAETFHGIEAPSHEGGGA